MKTGHGTSCSCTSCAARSESERPSLRKIIADGSRIDKLYLEKYIPLREQKLLTKLIRTRAVYDDVRKELLSSSNVSVRDRADLRPRQRGSKHDDRDKSSSQAVLELVDLVDRGKASGSHKNLTECCSCCICQPNGPHANDGKEHKRHGYGHHESAHAHHKNERDSRRGTHAHNRQKYRGDLHARHGSGHAISKIRETPSKRQLHMKAKDVRSVPCTCTFDIKGTIQRKSKAMIKRMKMRPKKAVPGMEYVYGEQYEEERTFETHGAYKAKALANKSLQKLKESETRIKRGMEAGAKTSLRKLKESKFMVEEHLQAEATKSVEKLKTGARKSVEKIKTGARKSAEKLKTTKNIMQEKIKEVRKSLQSEQIPKPIPKGKVIAKKLEEKSFRIKKDSITIFREKLKLMEEMEAWACEHECFPEECDPEECLRILMRNRARRTRIRENKDKMSRKRERHIGKSSTSSSVNVQAHEITAGAKVGTTRKEGIRKMKSTEQAKEMKTGARAMTGIKQGTQMKFNEQTKEMKTGATVGTGKQATQIKYTEQAKEMRTSTRVGSGRKEEIQQIKPQISINISTRKKKEGTINVDTGTGKKDDILCLCKDHKSRSVKSMTDITQSSAKPSKTASTGDVNKKQIKRRMKLRKVSSTRVVQSNVAQEDTHTEQDGTPRTTVSNSSVNRQAVRISSSFSFNIEFYKDKPVKSSQTELEQEPDISNINQKHSGTDVNKKHRGIDTSKSRQRHRTSEARQKKLKKDTQAGGHALKRCFCTLKLKSKRTKVKLTKSATKGTTAPKHLKGVTRRSTESVQTKKPHYHQKGLRLKPYECEPGVCIPGECNPTECDKLIKQRGVKHHSARTSTARQTKSATSLTKSTSSSSSKRIQTYSPGKKNRIQRSSQVIRERPLVRSYTPQKQAVRIGSTFSFNIEFYKDKPTNYNVSRVTSYSRDFSDEQKNIKLRKRKLDKGVDRMDPRRLKNRHSQGSASTLKSKYTDTKHSLRRCFCTLKLKPGKGNVKTQLASKVSVTSRSVITQTRKLQEKRREVRYQRHEHKNLLAYECEPGICTPGKCNPYECLKILNKRQGPRIRRHEKQSNTNNKTRSAASFTSRSLTPKAKRVQSSVVTYQTEVPARQYKENVIIKKMPREVKTSPSSPNRQAIRIGSTFSFDIEFFKDRTTSIAPKYVSPPRKPKTIVKKNNLRDTGSQGDTNQNQVSIPVQVEKQQHHNARIGSTMKRCFCTMKLYKDKNKTKDKVKEKITTGTATPILKKKKHPITKEKKNTIMATKATKTKRINTHYAQNLKPYECEPYVCTPGDCDPNVCLERIKKRGHTKEFGTSTDQSKMRSGSSLTQNTNISSGTGTDITRLRRQKTYTKPYRTRKIATPPTRVKKSTDSVSMGHSRQAVKMGSNFSFNIEFYKDRQPLVQKKIVIRSPNVKTKINDNAVRHKKNTGAEAREIFMSTQDSQADGGKKKHKIAGIKPALKRCFCTLKLHKKDKQPQNTNTNLRPPKVYTISRMTIAETKMTTHRQKYEYKFDPHRKEYTHRSKRMIKIERRNLSLGSLIEYTRIVPKYDRVIESNSLLLTPFDNSSNNSSQQSIRNYSSFSINAKQIKGTNCNAFQSVSNSIVKDDTNNLSNPPQSTKEFREQKPFNLDLNRCQVTGGSSFLSRCFCTMNISTDVTGHKLKPYECEPGICVPYECDPYECQKLITRRMRTRASKMSGTDAASRSTFSYSNLTPSQRAIKLQSNIQKHSAKSAQARNAFVKSKSGPRRPHKQMVRVGSTFSFDIQFSKDRPPVTRKYREVPRLKDHSDTKSVKTVNQRAKGTKGRYFNRISRDSQSGSTMINKGSSGTPMLKRCFCTLKLQKRNEQEKRIQQKASHTTMTSPNTKMEALKAKTTSTSGQNTKAYKLPALEPNECEPNIPNIPGKCNPYKCLDIIKIRNRKYKTKGFGTASTESKSVSSLTYSKKIKGQRVQSDFRDGKSRGNGVKFRDSNRRHTQSTKYLSPNKQVVRIGSDFSFNIEFYKNRMAQDHFQDTAKTITPLLNTHSKKRANRTRRISTTTATRRHSLKSQAGIKTEHQASAVGPILKRCFCTLKLQKQSKPLQNEKVNNNMVSEGTKTRAVKEISTMHTRSVMTKANKLKLKPYECEPNACVPGECNPYECDKLIKNRLRKEFGTSTGPYEKISVSSMSSLTSKAKKVQNAGIQHKHHDRSLQAKDVIAQRTAINRFTDRPSRQSVRFGSRVSFDVEFFKDKSFNGSPTRSRLPKFKKERNYNESFNEQSSIGTKHKRNTTSKNIQDVKSQVLARKVRSTVTEMRPFLKRCFCTLRFNNNDNRIAKPVDKITKSKRKIVTTDNKIAKPAVTNAANSADIKEVMVILPPKVNTRSRKSLYMSTATKPKKRQPKRTQKRYPTIQNLGPYECEPGVCVPGKCNPNICAERIKRSGRGMQSRMSGTDGTRGRSISSYTSPSARAKCTQEKGLGYKHRTTGNKDRYVVEDRRFKSIQNPFRQAVRISSSFSFNIEFYKDKMPKPAEMPHTPDESNFKNILRHEETESKKVKNISVHSQGTRVRNRGLQLQGTKKESRRTGVRPFLKRCFCTLKLEKMRNLPSPNIPDSKSVKTSTPRHYKPKEETMSIGVGTKKNKYSLKPFECEPNICVPGECDPYKCLERIKMRNRSTATLTSKHAKCQDTQCYKDPSSRCKNTQCYIKSQRTKVSSTKELKHRTRYHQKSGNSNRQSLRIGSSFSFDCEFFKDLTPGFESRQRKVIGVNNQRNITNKDSHCQSTYCHEKSQVAGVRTEHKGSGMGPLLKRCFCTLKLIKTPYAANETKTVNFVSVNVKPQPAYLDSKAHVKKTATEKKCTARNPYDNQPQTIPGQYSHEPLFQMCVDSKNMTILNRDEIYEKVTKLKQPKKIKVNKRPTQSRKEYNYARQSLRYKRLSKLKTTKNHEEDNYMCQSRNTRGYPLQSAKLKAKQRPTTEEDSKNIRHTRQHCAKFDSGKVHSNFDRASVQSQYYNPYRQALRIGSSFSFDIELFKDINLGFTSGDPRAKEVIVKKYKSRALQDTTNGFASKSRPKERIERKYTNKASHDVPYPKEVTVGRVAVENDIKMSYLHLCNLKRTKEDFSRDRSCHEHNSDIVFANKNKHNLFSPCDVCENNRIVFTKKRNRGFNEIKTIFPYIPSKFNQKNSIGALLSYRACTVRKYRSRRNRSTNIFRIRNMTTDRNNVTTKLFDEEVSNYKKQLSREQNTNMSHSGNKFSIKNIIKRCTQLFNRSSKSALKAHKDFTSEHVHCTARFNELKKNHGRKGLQKTDAVKATLSDRGPSHSKIVSIPKKSKSLKMAKLAERDRRHKKYIDDIKQERKKYSNFQCGDTGLTYMTPMKNYLNKKCTPVAYRYNNQYNICSNCQVIYDKDTKYLNNQEKPMFMNEKVVQFALVSPDREIQHKRKTKKSKNVSDDCDDNLCGTEINVFCPCTSGRKALKLLKCQSSSRKQKVISPKEGILKNCQGDCKGSCESCAHTGNLKKHHKPKKNCQGDCQDNCEVCTHINNPQKLKKSKKVPKPKVPQDQEKCQTIKNSKTHKKIDRVTYQVGKEKHNCKVINDNENQEKTQRDKKKRKKSQKGEDDHFKCQISASNKENKSKKGKELKIPKKPCLQTNVSENPDKPKKCEETKKITKVRKMVCKTKKPCACCGLAQASKKTKSDTTPPPHHLHWFSSNDKKCKRVCETQSEEDAMMKVMKMFKKCRSKMSVLLPPRKIDTCDYTPMFQIRMDAHNMAILNRDEVNEKVTNLKKQQGGIDSITPEELRLLHGKSCRCCICQSKKHTQPKQLVGLSLSLAQRASKFGRMFGIGKEPCICGSAPCASELRKMEKKAEQQKKLEKRRKNPCVCGTKVCDHESLKMELKTHAISKKGAKKLKKNLKNKAKSKHEVAEQNRKKAKAMKEYLERQKRYKKQDDIRRKRRRKEERLMDAQVRKYRNTSAWLLAAESIVDIGHLAGKTATGFFRTLGRLIMDPKRTVRQFKDAKQDPGRILTNLKMAWSDSGIGSTARRVKKRVGAMTCFERFKGCMESNPGTNYIYHMCDKNPKARLTAKKRLVRRREPMDFECSLYMASLRKKPWLKMYYKFQWFYPHCISLLHLLRSVGDVMLFLLAVIVWSPCLLAMECCRTLMCCTLCTG